MKRKDGHQLLTWIGLIAVAIALAGKAPSKPKPKTPLKPGGGKFGGGGASGSW